MIWIKGVISKIFLLNSELEIMTLFRPWWTFRKISQFHSQRVTTSLAISFIYLLNNDVPLAHSVLTSLQGPESNSEQNYSQVANRIVGKTMNLNNNSSHNIWKHMGLWKQSTNINVVHSSISKLLLLPHSIFVITFYVYSWFPIYLRFKYVIWGIHERMNTS